MKKVPAVPILVLLCGTAAAQPDCGNTSTGLVPISDLGTGTYNGWTGGLYPGGSNERPPDHLAAGLAHAARVQPLDTSGAPDPVNGRIVWLSLGFSNATQEAQAFIAMANAQPDRNPRLLLVDGARGGQTATILSTPSDPGYANYWSFVVSKLASMGATPRQVQAVWFKDDNRVGTPPPSPQAHHDTLLAQCKRIMGEVHARFPNARLCYVASRIYAGYAATALNPEPYAYRNGWAMKHLIEAQIGGDPALRHDGPGANSPWISWGAYLWADGIRPRGDGLTWECPDDYADDGTHPSPAGRAKVANLLLDFFRNDPTTCPWFLSGCATTGLRGGGAAGGLALMPNPSSSGAVIRADPPLKDATVSILDMAGRQVMMIGGVSGREVRLARGGLPAGSYLARVTEEGVVRGITRMVVVD